MGLLGFLYSQLLVTSVYPTTSCAGQTIIVTGSNSGLGKEAARHFARLGASKVILAVRNMKAGEAAKYDIENTTRCNAAVIEVWPLDLASYQSVKSFATRASDLPRLDILLENAGITTNNWEIIKGIGHERTIAINVISTFFLAILMLPKLKSSAKDFGIQPRLTIVSSEFHGRTKFPEWKEPNTFDALNEPSKISFSERYPTSKLLEILLLRQIAPAIEGSGVILNALTPGLCHSELTREVNSFLTIFKFFFTRSTEIGSRTLVISAMAGVESHGKYMRNGKVDDTARSPFVRSNDGEKASEKVWEELRTILESIQPGVTGNL
ncbi:Short chain dehydrogenase [Lachnellula occidentalis]|uniref:Short chain dehydrogenase n=1 Tax=Lachnellula occidentalis TaxID=215460 RepID=A0A8H8UF62_9HELO|nr:Short chain dehydrogenase [Lachnellula occidentalis]